MAKLMRDELTQSIERLYDVFARYKALSKLEGSPLYGDLELWIKTLRSKNLRDLTADDLSLFAGKVMYTWGDENDYRCYLPRILELSAELKTPYEIWTLYSRLEEAHWKTWVPEEQDAIKQCSLELWKALLDNNSEKAEWEFRDYFHALAYFYPDFSELLDAWENTSRFSAIKHLVLYVFDERPYLFDQHYINSRDKNTRNIGQFKTWLTSDSILHKLEQAFYQYEKHDLAEKLSWVEQILRRERTLSGS